MIKHGTAGAIEGDTRDSIFDRELALENLAGDEEMFESLRESAAQEIQALLIKLCQSIDRGEAVASQRIAHTMKSTAQVVGATKTMKIARQMEYAARDNDLQEVASGLGALSVAIAELLQKLEAENER